MGKIDWHSSKPWGIIGLVLFVISLLVGPLINREWPSKVGDFITRNQSTVFLIGLSLVLIATVFKLWRKNRALNRKLLLIESPVADETSQFKRFESIDKIVYGHIAYRPLMYYDEVTDLPQGIGITLLEIIFGKDKIKRSATKATWNDLVENLANRKYDIVATPIFETRERSKHIAFCSPMFYSDIGMYVKKGSRILGRWERHSLTFTEAIDMARGMAPKVVAIEGEISGKMALKYLGLTKDQVQKWLKPEQASVGSLISAVNGEFGIECEVAFAEAFQADQTSEVVNGEVVNILKRKEILYPVSFAVRKSDYILRNYINLKLLEIEEKVQDGVLSIVLEELTRHERYKDYSLERIKEYFVREYGLYGVIHGSSGTSTPPPAKPAENGRHSGTEHESLRVREDVTNSRREADPLRILVNPGDAYAQG